MTSKEALMNIDRKYREKFSMYKPSTLSVDITNVLKQIYGDVFQEYPSILPEIKDVIFNNPATIILWKDGTKTVVKCGEGDKYDPEKGFAMAIAKKALGNKGNYYSVFREFVPEKKEEPEAYYLDNIDL